MHASTEQRRRYFDAARQGWVVPVLQGDYYMSSDPSVILDTTLGSCVSACVRDTVKRIGGMNHFLLPSSGSGDGVEGQMSLRYGNYSMEVLINELLKRGARRENLELKLFGGANVVKCISGIGHRNSDFIEQYVRAEGLYVASHHLRGQSARKIQFWPVSGRARMLQIAGEQSVFEREASRAPQVEVAASGDIELFD